MGTLFINCIIFLFRKVLSDHVTITHRQTCEYIGFGINFHFRIFKQCWLIKNFRKNIYFGALLWRHNGSDGVSNLQPHDCLLYRLFGHRSKKASKLCDTGLCAGNSPETAEFPVQMASNAENVFIWWRHYGNSRHLFVGSDLTMIFRFIQIFAIDHFPLDLLILNSL